jgi:hypothetical protein
VTEQAMTRGFLGLDRRGWPGTIVVAALIAVIAVGLPVLNALVSPQRLLPPGTVIDVGRATTFTAAGGWSEDVEATSPQEGRAVLTKGAISYLTEARPSTQSLEDEYARFADDIRHSAGAQLFNSATTFTTESGLTGISGSYTSPMAEGVFAVFRAGDTAVRVLAKGPPDAMTTYLDDVERMVQTLRIGTA